MEAPTWKTTTETHQQHTQQNFRNHSNLRKNKLFAVSLLHNILEKLRCEDENNMMKQNTTTFQRKGKKSDKHNKQRKQSENVFSSVGSPCSVFAFVSKIKSEFYSEILWWLCHCNAFVFIVFWTSGLRHYTADYV